MKATLHQVDDSRKEPRLQHEDGWCPLGSAEIARGAVRLKLEQSSEFLQHSRDIDAMLLNDRAYVRGVDVVVQGEHELSGDFPRGVFLFQVTLHRDSARRSIGSGRQARVWRDGGPRCADQPLVAAEVLRKLDLHGRALASIVAVLYIKPCDRMATDLSKSIRTSFLTRTVEVSDHS